MSNLCSTCLLHDEQLAVVSSELLLILTNLLQSSQFNYKLNGDAIKICAKCNSALQDMYKFRDTALKNLEYLNSVTQNAPKLLSKVKVLKIEQVTDLTKIIKKPIKAKKIIKKVVKIPPPPPNMVTPVVDIVQQEVPTAETTQNEQVLEQQTDPLQLPQTLTQPQQPHNQTLMQAIHHNQVPLHQLPQMSNMNQMGGMTHMDMSHMNPMGQYNQMNVPMRMEQMHNKIEITVNPETKLEYANLQPSLMSQASVSGMHGMHPHMMTASAPTLNTQMEINPEMKSTRAQQRYHQLQPAQKATPNTTAEQQKESKDFGYHYLTNTQYFIKVLSNDEVLQRMDLKRKKKEFVSAKHKCKSCVIIFKTAEQAKQHTQECHEESRGRFACYICTRRFTTMVSMNKHISLHCTNVYVCSKCSYESVDKRSLQTHICKRAGAKRSFTTNYDRKSTKC